MVSAVRCTVILLDYESLPWNFKVQCLRFLCCRFLGTMGVPAEDVIKVKSAGIGLFLKLQLRHFVNSGITPASAERITAIITELNKLV